MWVGLALSRSRGLTALLVFSHRQDPKWLRFRVPISLSRDRCGLSWKHTPLDLTNFWKILLYPQAWCLNSSKILTYSLSYSQLLHIHRGLERYDSCRVRNLSLSDSQWLQASLPIKACEREFLFDASLALPAFWAPTIQAPFRSSPPCSAAHSLPLTDPSAFWEPKATDLTVSPLARNERSWSWDATVSDILAASYLSGTYRTARAVTEMPEHVYSEHTCTIYCPSPC